MQKFKQILNNSELTPEQQARVTECMENLCKTRQNLKTLMNEIPSRKENYEEMIKNTDESIIIMITSSVNPNTSEDEIDAVVEHYLN